MTITEALVSFDTIFSKLHRDPTDTYVEPEFFALAVIISGWINRLCYD